MRMYILMKGILGEGLINYINILGVVYVYSIKCRCLIIIERMLMNWGYVIIVFEVFINIYITN